MDVTLWAESYHGVQADEVLLQSVSLGWTDVHKGGCAACRLWG